MTSPFGTKFNPFSSSFRSQLNEVGSYAIDWGMNGDDIKRRVAENFPNLGGGPQPFLAQLNIAASLGANRWKYGWEAFVPGIAASAKGYPGQGSAATATESTWDPISARLSSMVGTDPYGFYAVNGAEVANDGSPSEQSYGVHTASGGPTITLLSIGNLASTDDDESTRAVIVPMFRMFETDAARGSLNYWFSAGNEVKVEC